MRIRYGQVEQSHRELDVLLDEFDAEHDAAIGPRKLRCGMVMSYCLRGARLGGAPSEAIMDQLMSAIDTLAKKRTWPAVCRFMHAYLDQLLAHVEPRSRTRLTRLIARMQRELTQDPQHALTLRQYADDIGVHPDYLCRQFKKTTGQTFTQTRRLGRITRARHLLAATGLKISAISRSVGMNDPAQFTRDFKKETGLTPRQFRLAHERG